MTGKKGIFATVAGLFGGKPEPNHPPVVPPVDLDVPVTNPLLVAAIARHQQARQNETAAALFAELKRSVLLAAVVLDKRPTPTSPGQAIFEKGSRIAVVEVVDPANARLFAVFTDHAEVRRFTDQSNSTLVMPTRDALSFVLDHGYAGLVVNPASEATLRLDAPFIRTIIGGM